MNHQIYLDWLFEDAQDLTVQQSTALHEHLEGCEKCRSLSGSFRSLEVSLSEAVMVPPAPGFADRWQTHLLAKQDSLHRGQIITILSIIAGALVLFVGLMLVVLWPWLRSPDLLFYTWIYQLFSLYTYAESLRDLVSPIFEWSSGAIPWIALLFSLGFFSEMVVLWVISYRLLSNPRRISL